MMSYWESAGKCDEWNTPQCVFDALDTHFDMDVAASRSVFQCVPAKMHIYENSLNELWCDFIWMNPPFGGRNCITPWLDKFFRHGNGIALAPDRTSAPWFKTAFSKSDLVLFTKKLKFLRNDGSEGRSPSNGTALFGVGTKAVSALHHAQIAGFGFLAVPVWSLISRLIAQSGQTATRIGQHNDKTPDYLD